MTRCFKCGKILPGDMRPGEYVMCRECEAVWRGTETAVNKVMVEQMRKDVMKLKPIGWIFTPHQKEHDRLTIEIDRKPIVLCQDCVYWQDNNDGYPHPECRWGHEETPDPEDYCSFGERKGDA